MFSIVTWDQKTAMQNRYFTVITNSSKLISFYILGTYWDKKYSVSKQVEKYNIVNRVIYENIPFLLENNY